MELNTSVSGLFQTNDTRVLFVQPLRNKRISFAYFLNSLFSLLSGFSGVSMKAARKKTHTESYLIIFDFWFGVGISLAVRRPLTGKLRSKECTAWVGCRRGHSCTAWSLMEMGKASCLWRNKRSLPGAGLQNHIPIVRAIWNMPPELGVQVIPAESCKCSQASRLVPIGF